MGPNVDRSTLHLLTWAIGAVPGPQIRSQVFRWVCVPVRVVMAVLAYYASPFLVALASFLVLLRLYSSGMYGRWWWSRPFHFGTCVLLLLLAAHGVHGLPVVMLLAVDVFGGLGHSMYITRC